MQMPCQHVDCQYANNLSSATDRHQKHVRHGRRDLCKINNFSPPQSVHTAINLFSLTAVFKLMVHVVYLGSNQRGCSTCLVLFQRRKGGEPQGANGKCLGLCHSVTYIDRGCCVRTNFPPPLHSCSTYWHINPNLQ